MVYFTLLLLYPRVASSCLQVYVCHAVENVDYLVADFNLNCYTSEWTTYALINIIFLILYPIGIPVFFFLLIRKTRKDFNYLQPVLRYRIGLLYDPYTEDMWFFEELDLIHKLALTGLIRYFPQNAQLNVGMAVTIAYFLVLLVASPYVHTNNQQLHLVAQIDLFLFMLAGSVFLAGEVPTPAEDTLMSLCLLISGAIFLGIFVYRAWSRFRDSDAVKACCFKIHETSCCQSLTKAMPFQQKDTSSASTTSHSRGNSNSAMIKSELNSTDDDQASSDGSSHGRTKSNQAHGRTRSNQAANGRRTRSGQ
jgi:hypothetical protein